MTRTLSEKWTFDQVRTYQFQKQFLLEKVPQDQYSEVLKSQIGLHCTDSLTPYLSLWARVENFDPQNLFDDLTSEEVRHMRAFRGTVFTVHRKHTSDITGSLPMFLKPKLKEATRILVGLGIDYERIEEAILSLLSKSGMHTTRQIRKELPFDVEGGALTLLTRRLEFSGSIVRSGPRYLTDRVIFWKLADSEEQELGGVREESLRSLTLKYIRRFGPICIKDLSWWFPVTKTKATSLISELSDQLVEIDFNGRQYWIEAHDYSLFKNHKMPEMIKMPLITVLPYEDHFTKSYMVRNWYLEQEITPLVTFKGRMNMGQIQPSIWMDGRIVGRWIWIWEDKKKTRGKARIAELQENLRLREPVVGQINDRLKNLETFMNEKMVPLINKR